MFLAAALPPFILTISLVVLFIFFTGLGLKRLGQPYIISYILAGVLLGGQGLGVITDHVAVAHMGELGIILLLFFIGMEIDLPRFIRGWRVAIIGTSVQIGASVALMLALGWFAGWPAARSVLMGFVIALSSSAVIIRLLQDKGLVDTRIGRHVLTILLTQDVLIVPLLILTSFLGGRTESTGSLLLLLAGGALIVGILVTIYRRSTVRIPLAHRVEGDHELQVFLALFLCFGGALVSGLFGLSPALGAFVGGMVMHAARETHWIHNTLHSFRVLFVSIFFIGVGLQIDLDFIAANAGLLLGAIAAVYVTNHLLNSVILRTVRNSWADALLGGALLAQIGELSFLLADSAHDLDLFGSYGYHFTISLISLTLFISPFWIAATQALSRRMVRR